MPRSASPSAAASGAPLDELPFEEALSRLEQVVDRLEQGDLELEASLAAFEEGVKLSRRCNAQLEAAEQRVEVLTREGGEWLIRPFDEDDAPEDPDEDVDEDADENGDEDELEERDE